MNKTNLFKFAEFLEDYDGNFDLDEYDLMELILEKCGFKREREGEGWFGFSSRIFNLYWVPDEWYWCFYWQWRNIDNSAIGCAARIRILLDDGLPENWNEQMRGREYLNYNLEDLKLIKEIEKVLE